jgi:formyltetrahydrofolate-dependent phosphoribosylglycinamide formyltransferase
MYDTPKKKIAAFISGGGSNLKALIDATKMRVLDAEIAWVVSSTKKAGGLKIAADNGIETFVFRPSHYDSPDTAANDLLGKLREREIDYIACAGYLKLLPEKVVHEYKNRITNIHPALLPKHGGKGMYGHFVHEAVLAAGEKESGVTIHLVNEEYDEGQILEQTRVEVLEGDTPDTLAARVLKQEHRLYARVLNRLIKGEYSFEQSR